MVMKLIMFHHIFQPRGATHIHSLIWMKIKNSEDAPNLWMDPEENNQDQSKANEDKTKNKK